MASPVPPPVLMDSLPVNSQPNKTQEATRWDARAARHATNALTTNNGGNAKSRGEKDRTGHEFLSFFQQGFLGLLLGLFSSFFLLAQLFLGLVLTLVLVLALVLFLLLGLAMRVVRIWMSTHSYDTTHTHIIREKTPTSIIRTVPRDNITQLTRNVFQHTT